LFWSGSKAGWLIGLVLGLVCLLRMKWPARLKWGLFLVVLLGGLAVFAARFHNYFAAGATSAGARFDYWRAALRITVEHPAFGTGPGTFQRPYARLKSPDAEMARLAHNDYLEQFSDSGFIGGLSYASWIGLLLYVADRRIWRADDWLLFALFLGLLGWFFQGLTEFSLYVPGLAWTVFALAGCLLRTTGNEFDKRQPPR
jgi:O-antigen ligase